MAPELIPVRIGETEILVETTKVPGSEQTSRLATTAEGVTDAFAQAQQTILELAASTARTLEESGRRSVRPDGLTVEFGLKVAASGKVIVAGASAEATLRVTLSYGSRG